MSDGRWAPCHFPQVCRAKVHRRNLSKGLGKDSKLEHFRNARRLFKSIERWLFLEEKATKHSAFGLHQFRKCYSPRFAGIASQQVSGMVRWMKPRLPFIPVATERLHRQFHRRTVYSTVRRVRAEVKTILPARAPVAWRNRECRGSGSKPSCRLRGPQPREASCPCRCGWCQKMLHPARVPASLDQRSQSS
jgi:hypothetical protein